MSAQDKWKRDYLIFKTKPVYSFGDYPKRNWRAFLKDERREAALERIIERQARTIEARENSVLEIWQDWRIERDNVVLAREQRDEARQLAVDFKAALESAQRNYTEATEMLKAIGAALNVRTLGEIIPAIEAHRNECAGLFRGLE